MREQLLDKYRSAEPALDAIRGQVIAQELNEEPEMGFWATSWLELFVKPRLAWGGIAAVWVVVFGLNLADGIQSGARTAQKPVEPTGQVRQMVWEQKRLRDEMLGLGVAVMELSPADRPQGLKPRSELWVNQMAA